MKFILLVIIVNLQNPNADALIAHKSFANRAQCESAQTEVQAKPLPQGVSGYAKCISEDELLELDRV